MSANSTNRGYILQTAGENPGTWGLDPGLNGALQTIDTNLGGVASVALSSSNVTLSSTQYANGTIRLSGTLLNNVAVTFPAVQGWWTVENLTTGSFIVGIGTGLGQAICVEQGSAADILIDGTNVKFRNLPPVGTYLDVIDSTVPLWIANCTVPPYLLCDGSTFSAVTYPYLNTKLGGTTLPDLRGRSRFYLDGGTGRITTAGSSIDGATRLSAGGAQNVQLTQAQLPNFNLSLATLSATLSSLTLYARTNMVGTSGSITVYTPAVFNSTQDATGVAGSQITMGGTLPLGGSNSAHTNMPPAQISGITMIRAA